MLRKISVEVQVLRNGGFLGILRGFHNNPPEIKMESSAEIKTVFQGTFQKKVHNRIKEEVDFNPYGDEIQPVLTINGIRYPLGIFVPVRLNPFYDENAETEMLKIEAYDRAWLVKTTTGTERVYFKKGTAYLDAVEQLLSASGISMIERRTECDEVFFEDREDWDLGTDYLTIVNDLLAEINFKQLWFDSSGAAILEQIATPTVRHIQHTLDARQVTSLVRPGLDRKMDFYSIPNVYICVCDNPEKNAPLTAVARNTNQYSPLSIQRRGREIVSFVSVSNTASQNALQRYADRLIFESMMGEETIEIDTNLLPGWGIGDVVTVHYKDVHALCISRSWSMQLKAGGTMAHTFEKITYNIDDDIEQ